MKTAIQWSKRSGKEDWACRISIALLRFWLNKNLLLEAKQTQEDLLSIALPDRYPMLRLKLLQGLGTIYLNITNYRKAVLIFQEILDTWTRLGKPEEIAVNQNNLGWALLASGEGEKGEGLTLKALKYFEETGNLRGQCLSYTNLGALHLFSFGHPKKAITFFERSLALREQMGDERGVAFIKGYLGICYFKTGESDKGKKLLEESIAISRSRNDLYLVDFSLVWLAEQAFDYWDQQALIPLIKEIEDNNRAIGAPYGFSGYLYFFKGMSEAGRDTGKGEVWIEKGLQITEEYSIFVPVLLGRQIRGFILLKDRDYEKALETFQESLQMCHHHGNAIWMADALELIGVLLTEKGLWKTAACLLGKAKAVREDLETPVPPRNRPYISRTMALLEEKLGSQGFQATLEKSRQLDLEEAVSLATHREGRKKQP